MTAFALKMIAVISMAIDHAGHTLFPELKWLRHIGRLAFPIYAFFIVEGFHRTRNAYKYLARLSIFALISEIPFDLALRQGKWFDPASQNGFFTLALGLLMLILLDKYKDDLYLRCLVVLSVCMIADALNTDYRWRGILVILMFELFRFNPFMRIVSTMLIFTKIMYWTQGYASLAHIPLSMYNGKKGPDCKMFFYAFYPVHLLIIYFVARGT